MQMEISRLTKTRPAPLPRSKGTRRATSRALPTLGAHGPSYGYDRYNNVVSVTDPTNVAVNLARDILGNVLSLTDALNNTTNFAYDADSQLSGGGRPDGECGKLYLRQKRKPQFGNRSSAKRHGLHLRLQGAADTTGGRAWENHRFFLHGHRLSILRRGRRKAHLFVRRGRVPRQALPTI